MGPLLFFGQSDQSAAPTGFQEFDQPQSPEQTLSVRGNTNLFTGLFGVKANYLSSASPQENESCAWWNVACKVGKAGEAVGGFVQSTLLKVIVLVLVVGISLLFLMSYVQAKGGKLA